MSHRPVLTVALNGRRDRVEILILVPLLTAPNPHPRLARQYGQENLMSFPPERIKHLLEVEEGRCGGTFIVCILCFIYGSREAPEGIIMSLDVSRAAVIGGVVVEATLAKHQQHIFLKSNFLRE